MSAAGPPQGAWIALEDAVTLREALMACDGNLACAFRLAEWLYGWTVERCLA